MAGSTFVYVTFIRTSPKDLWSALTSPEFMKKYCFGAHFGTDWKVGSSWAMIHADGRVTDAGEILEMEPPKRLVLKWQNEWKPELKAEGYSQCVFEIEPEGGATKLTVTHSMEQEGSKLIGAVSGGWPRILSNLKSLIETGEVALASKTP
ncbi:SRPBCC family protein [Rhizobium tubonense]|uniref:ATPase n=1 Tax=Rhizobium tubonense TaxID=484088 RepID=A0A2W4DM66_9HYPH|nr:SRPBCC family protein [Rhizobium tubonense]PZM17114.1 ATPase [Rhizobium tubonense]